MAAGHELTRHLQLYITSRYISDVHLADNNHLVDDDLLTLRHFPQGHHLCVDGDACRLLFHCMS